MFDRWSAVIKSYPWTSRLGSWDRCLNPYMSLIGMLCWSYIELYAFKSETFEKLWAEILFKCQRHTEKYMAPSVYHVIWGKVKITPLGTIEFLDTHVCINNPHWQSSGIIIFLSNYYMVISNRLVGSFLDVLFLLLAIILSELYEKPRRKYLATSKST